MFLFDTLKEKYHTCGMDNLYTSTRVCKDTYNHPNKVMCHGVARRSGRGIPSFVLQDEVTNLKDQLKVRGTVKAVELKGDANCPNLCSVSMYDTKPVHFMTMAKDRIEWIKKKCKVYNKDLGKLVDPSSTIAIMVWVRSIFQTSCGT